MPVISHLLKAGLLLIALPMAASCGAEKAPADIPPEAAEDAEQDEKAAIGSDACSREALAMRAGAFHSVVRQGNAESALSFYEEGFGEYEYGLYFGAKGGNSGAFIFDPDTDYTTIPLSSYQEADGPSGELVVYVQSQLQENLNDPEFLDVGKGRKFFVCHWICKDDLWVISSRHTCFEETDGPFGQPDDL